MLWLGSQRYGCFRALLIIKAGISGVIGSQTEVFSYKGKIGYCRPLQRLSSASEGFRFRIA